jgi:sulfatase modifying factor 1
VNSNGTIQVSVPMFYRVRGVHTGLPNPDPARLVWIPPGTFTMGSPEIEPARYPDETQHEVTISRGFWMGKYEVTQREYAQVIYWNPSYFRNGITGEGFGGEGGPVTNELRHPVEQVSWFQCSNYCVRLTERERLAGRLPVGYEYRLPTEAEWEYASRAGKTTPFSFGSELRSGNGYVNFEGHYEYPPCGGQLYWCYNPSGIFLGRTVEVGSYEPNAWGLYDMHGNVWEWCQDYYEAYSVTPVTDPTGPAAGSDHVVRGGSSFDHADGCRSAGRYHFTPGEYGINGGFRVVLVAVP